MKNKLKIKHVETTKLNGGKQIFASISLFLCSFFLPFGFDWLFALTIKITGSFWVADAIFYAISLTFFIIYCVLSNKKPIEFFMKKRN